MKAQHFPEDQLAELVHLGSVSVVVDGVPLVLIEDARLPTHLTGPKKIDVLLCPSARDGYMTRLFFSARVTGRNTPNWRDEVRLIGRAWQSYSFQGVPPSLRLAQILSAHLGALG